MSSCESSALWGALTTWMGIAAYEWGRGGEAVSGKHGAHLVVVVGLVIEPTHGVQLSSGCEEVEVEVSTGLGIDGGMGGGYILDEQWLS